MSLRRAPPPPPAAAATPPPPYGGTLVDGEVRGALCASWGPLAAAQRARGRSRVSARARAVCRVGHVSRADELLEPALVPRCAVHFFARVHFPCAPIRHAHFLVRRYRLAVLAASAVAGAALLLMRTDKDTVRARLCGRARGPAPSPLLAKIVSKESGA